MGGRQAVLARSGWVLCLAEDADPRVVTMVQTPLEAAIATGVDLGDLDGAPASRTRLRVDRVHPTAVAVHRLRRRRR